MFVELREPVYIQGSNYIDLLIICMEWKFSISNTSNAHNLGLKCIFRILGDAGYYY